MAKSTTSKAKKATKIPAKKAKSNAKPKVVKSKVAKATKKAAPKAKATIKAKAIKATDFIIFQG